MLLGEQPVLFNQGNSAHIKAGAQASECQHCGLLLGEIKCLPQITPLLTLGGNIKRADGF